MPAPPSAVSAPQFSYPDLNLRLAVTKGIGANMLKVGSKRRRTKAQVKADKEAAEPKD